MRKYKKSYGRVSVIFAVLVMMFVVVLSNGQSAHAAGTGNDGIQTPSGNDIPNIPDIPDPTDQGNGNQPSDSAASDSTNGFTFSYNNEEGTLSGNVRVLIILTILSLVPSILIMMTSFTRIVVVLHFLRTAIGTQTAPPNQVLVGLALFLTLFIMQPVFTQINENAIKPFDAGEITQEEAVEIAGKPMREFMNGQVQTKDIDLFIQISGQTFKSYDEVPFSILIPSFIISELRTAFIIGFLIYIPFIVIDMVVASVLMSMGMMMLPPTTISLPFKILLFVLADGWNLVIGSLVKTFY